MRMGQRGDPQVRGIARPLDTGAGRAAWFEEWIIHTISS